MSMLIVSDVREALEQALGRHGLHTFHPIAVCAMLEVIASPLKAQVGVAADSEGRA